MYAQSRPMPPPVRIPDHYSGNAFRADTAPPLQRVDADEGTATHEPPSPPAMPVRPQGGEEAAGTADAALHQPEHTPLLPRLPDGTLALGIGNEELLLLGLIFLLYSAGSSGREELLLCLVLLLFYGG